MDKIVLEDWVEWEAQDRTPWSLDGGNIKEGGWRDYGKLKRQLQKEDRGVREFPNG